MILTYTYRLVGAACLLALITNVYKHGWHPSSILIGASCAALMLSLGVRPDRRTIGWEIRYVLTALVFVGLATFRFLL